MRRLFLPKWLLDSAEQVNKSKRKHIFANTNTRDVVGDHVRRVFLLKGLAGSAQVGHSATCTFNPTSSTACLIQQHPNLKKQTTNKQSINPTNNQTPNQQPTDQQTINKPTTNKPKPNQQTINKPTRQYLRHQTHITLSSSAYQLLCNINGPTNIQQLTTKQPNNQPTKSNHPTTQTLVAPSNLPLTMLPCHLKTDKQTSIDHQPKKISPTPD